jgi:hypothetical protein
MVISNCLHNIYTHKTINKVPFTLLAGVAIIRDIIYYLCLEVYLDQAMLDPDKPPDRSNEAENGLASEEPLVVKLALSNQSKRFS